MQVLFAIMAINCYMKFIGDAKSNNCYKPIEMADTKRI